MKKPGSQQGWYARAVAALRSRRFFYVILGLFGVQASWIALSGRFPMAYDEGAHFGLIRLYAERWLPFWSQQPAGTETYGALIRDPSYLYHYLISFPYRIFAHFVHSEIAQIITLRFVSILLFGIGLVLLRKLLLKTKASMAVVHLALALFVLTPLIPAVAAQINYDNLFFPLVMLALLLTVEVSRAIKKGHISLSRLLLLLSLCLLGSLVKYAFLPLFAGITGWLLFQTYRRGHQRGWGRLKTAFRQGWKQLSQPARIGLLVLVILSGGLFMERYGLNTIRYHSPLPACEKVLSEQRCYANGPWRRDYLTYQDKIHGRLALTPLTPAYSDPVRYTYHIWAPSMYRQLFYALNGEASQYQVGKPLPLARQTILVLGSIGLVLFIWWQRRLRRDYQLNFLFIASLLYVGTLWLLNYKEFHRIGLAVAIQARYLLPILPLLYLTGVLVYQKLLRSLPRAKAGLATLTMAALLFGGGGATVFIVRSDATWYWQNRTVNRMNQYAQAVLKKIVIGS